MSCPIPACVAIWNQRALEQAIRALTLELQAGTIGLVVLDVGEAPSDALRRLPFTTWLGLQRMVEGAPDDVPAGCRIQCENSVKTLHSPTAERITQKEAFANQ